MNKNTNPSPKVAVALSGGVDSSVAAALLKEQGYAVTAVFFDCWQKNTGCDTDKERRDALQVASKLNIPLRIFDFREEYRQKVLDYFYAEYRAGRTPNPDIMCNKEIKFGLFLNKALQELNVDTIATGHYARNIFHHGTYHLLQGTDKSKDQSYFLYLLKQEQLSKTIFPVGEMSKQEVRQKAKNLHLANWDKPDSQGICFIGEIKLFDFLRREIPEQKGPVVDRDGKIIGEHHGVWFYTIGQRHGFSVHKYQGIPLYVSQKIAATNTLVVGPQEEILNQDFTVENLSWIQNKPFAGRCLVRIRHLGELIPAQILKEKTTDRYQVKLSRPIFAITPGQSAVFYRKEEVLGGGIIV